MVPPENSQLLLHENADSWTVSLSALLPESWGWVGRSLLWPHGTLEVGVLGCTG